VGGSVVSSDVVRKWLKCQSNGGDKLLKCDTVNYTVGERVRGREGEGERERGEYHTKNFTLSSGDEDEP
jgi:hypothetical protein